MSDDAAIEAMAKALAGSMWHAMDERDRYGLRSGATVALAAYRQHQREAGIVEVPREPNEIMKIAGHKAILYGTDVVVSDVVDAWTAMIAAAQEREG